MIVKEQNPNDEEKVEMITELIKRLSLDAALINEVSTKWTSVAVDKIERKIKQIDRGLLVAPTDSKQLNAIKNAYSPGGLLSVFLVEPYRFLKKKK